MHNLHYRLIFDLGKSRRKNRNSWKEPFDSSRIPKLENKENIALPGLQVFYVFVLHVKIVTIFEPKLVPISARNTI